MKKIICLIAVLIFGLWLTCSIAYAFDVPKPDGYILDQAQLFSEQQEKELELQVKEIEMSTTAEIGVLTVKSLNGEDAGSVAFEVGEKWGVGKKQNSNGLLILISKEDRDWYIATGYGTEGVITDAVAKIIGENLLVPQFKNGNYYLGIKNTIDELGKYIGGDPGLRAQYDNESQSTANELSGFQGVILVVLILWSIVKSFFVAGGKGAWTKILLVNIFQFIFTMIVLDTTFAIVILAISLFVDLMVYLIVNYGGNTKGGSGSGSGWTSGSSSSWGSSSSSGSSSSGSFGGGSFGGGGAGGKW